MTRGSRFKLRRPCALLLALAAVMAGSATVRAQVPKATPAAGGNAAAESMPGDPSGATLRDPFEVTPQMRMGLRAGPPGAFVQMLRSGEGTLPSMKLKGLMEGPSGRIALVEVEGLGLFRVREGENVQLSPSIAMKVRRIGRDELVVNPQDLGDAPGTLVIR